MSRRTLDTTLTFLKGLDRAASPADVTRRLMDLLRPYGVEALAAAVFHGPGVRPRDQVAGALLQTMPAEWTRRYVARGYMFEDPTIRHLGFAREPFSWPEAVTARGQDAAARTVMGEAAEFGVGTGYTVPLLTLDNELAGFGFAGRRVEVSPEERDVLHVVATYAFAQLLLMQRTAVALPAVRLAPREREALQWVAEGKTSWEIGSVMTISEKGVEQHLRSVRRKLGAINSSQAVAIALRHGLIT